MSANAEFPNEGITKQMSVLFEGLTADDTVVSLLRRVLAVSQGVNVSGVKIYVGEGDVATSPSRATMMAAGLTEVQSRSPTMGELAVVLIHCGTKLFDAVLFVMCRKEQRRPFQIITAIRSPKVDEQSQQKAAVASLFLFIRSNRLCLRPDDKVPAIFSYTSTPKIDKRMFNDFLSDMDPEEYPAEIFNAVKAEWLGEKMCNSLHLGMAGLRQMQFLADVHPDSEAKIDVAEAVARTRALYHAVKDEGFGNTARPKNFIKEFGSLNNYLNMLILAAYTKETLVSAAKSRRIYSVPSPTLSSLPECKIKSNVLFELKILKNRESDADTQWSKWDCARFDDYVSNETRRILEMSPSSLASESIKSKKDIYGWTPKLNADERLAKYAADMRQEQQMQDVVNVIENILDVPAQPSDPDAQDLRRPLRPGSPRPELTE
jgi:hypothetical protein